MKQTKTNMQYIDKDKTCFTIKDNTTIYYKIVVLFAFFICLCYNNIMDIYEFDLLVVGAGPSGLMCALQAKGDSEQNNKKVLVIDSNDKCGKKLYITGKGRCNLTNHKEPQEFLNNVVSNPKFLNSAINAFSPYDTIRFFESNGCHVVVERGGRVFPKSNKASDITKVLETVAKKRGVEIHFNQKLKRVFASKSQVLNDNFDESDINCDRLGGEILCGESKEKNNFTKHKFIAYTQDREYHCNALVLATGGVSYPLTGSDGSCFSIMRELGHAIVSLKPALVGIELFDNVASLQGLSLRNVELSVCYKNKSITKSIGEMLFTGVGITGPLVLSASSIINRLDLSQVRLIIDLKPAMDYEQLDNRILRDWQELKNRQFKNSLNELLPSSLIPWIVDRSSIDGLKLINSVTKVQRHQLSHLLKNIELKPKKLNDITTGIVTAGGVDTVQLNPKTMQSKLYDNLYCIGEMLDVDGLTGGYNIQIALSTGYLAGNHFKKQNDF